MRPATCELHGCTDERPVCHRCHQAADVAEHFIIDSAFPVLAGSTAKAVGHWSHACPRCIAEWESAVEHGMVEP